MSHNNKMLSYIEKMKLKAAAQQNYGGKVDSAPAKMEAVDCPNCGAGRAKQEGVTNCAYCGFTFIQVTLTDGLHIKKEDNSK